MRIFGKALRREIFGRGTYLGVVLLSVRRIVPATDRSTPGVGFKKFKSQWLCTHTQTYSRSENLINYENARRAKKHTELNAILNEK